MVSPTLQEIQRNVRENALWFWIGGALFILLGVLAIAMPFAATLAANILIGVLLAVGGVFEIVRAFGMRRTWRIVGTVLFGLIALAAGVLLLFFPLEGILTLTAVVAVFFILGGLFRFLMAFDARPAGGWGWMVVSGILSIAIGVIILIAYPGAALWTLGVLLGVDFLFFGGTLLATVIAARDGELADQGA
jgi:uncharacterized membrane protein HdeD (DUF308 family)